MLPAREKLVELPVPEHALAQLRSGISAARPVANESTATASPATLPAAAPTTPTLRCGWCHGTIDDVGAGHVARCPHCRQSVKVPPRITVTCGRCGHAQHIHVSELATERLCPTCSQSIVVGDVVLAPRRRRARHRRRRRTSSNYTDAAWAVLIIGLSLVVAMLALTIL